MFETALLAALVAAGVVTALQALLTLRGRRNARPNFLERPLIEALELKDPAKVRAFVRSATGVATA